MRRNGRSDYKTTFTTTRLACLHQSTLFIVRRRYAISTDWARPVAQRDQFLGNAIWVGRLRCCTGRLRPASIVRANSIFIFPAASARTGVISADLASLVIDRCYINAQAGSWMRAEDHFHFLVMLLRKIKTEARAQRCIGRDADPVPMSYFWVPFLRLDTQAKSRMVRFSWGCG